MIEKYVGVFYKYDRTVMVSALCDILTAESDPAVVVKVIQLLVLNLKTEI